ncbi:hypothetical protein [Streptomyces sp. ATCC 21386]|uniref:hypothetical protein n=1 Tax=Streptomyces sp. ATCC 21386 TaxID=2699428 RepID=UPI001BFFB0D5|nr:hypothetical protein [Streptomyces sp. ATCC 21386]
MTTSSAPPGSERARTDQMIVLGLAWLRGAQFALWIWVPAAHGLGRYQPEVFITYVLAAIWSAVLFTVAIRRRRLTPRWVVGDVAVAAICAVVVGRAYPPAEAASITNWVIPPLCGVAVTAAIYAGRLRVPAVAVVVGAWLVGAWPATDTSGARELFSNAAMMALFAAVAGVTGALLTRAAQPDCRCADPDDGILRTLDSIARGDFDDSPEDVKDVCRREAARLRGADGNADGNAEGTA